MLTSEHRIPFNLWRADHWYNKPVKKATRPLKHDYSYYFKHKISITTSGNFNTLGLKFCVEQLGVERCLYSVGRTHFPDQHPDVQAGTDTGNHRLSVRRH